VTAAADTEWLALTPNLPASCSRSGSFPQYFALDQLEKITLASCSMLIPVFLIA